MTRMKLLRQKQHEVAEYIRQFLVYSDAVDPIFNADDDELVMDTLMDNSWGVTVQKEAREACLAKFNEFIQMKHQAFPWLIEWAGINDEGSEAASALDCYGRTECLHCNCCDFLRDEVLDDLDSFRGEATYIEDDLHDIMGQL